jgi:hypothetical protein
VCSSDLTKETPSEKAKRVKRELLAAGATLYGIWKSESRYLPKVLHNNEQVEAVIYGQHDSSSAMLVATNERIIYLDKKIMAALCDEVSYEVISGIQLGIHLIFASVILHTPVKNYNFKFVNMRCAENFARHIEAHRLKRKSIQEGQKQLHEPFMPARHRVIHNNPEGHATIDDMSGYYWLPMEEDEEEERMRA